MVPKAGDKNFPKKYDIKQGPPLPKGKHQKLASFKLTVVSLKLMTLDRKL